MHSTGCKIQRLRFESCSGPSEWRMEENITQFSKWLTAAAEDLVRSITKMHLMMLPSFF